MVKSVDAIAAVLWITDHGETSYTDSRGREFNLTDTGIGEVSFRYGCYYVGGSVQSSVYELVTISDRQVEVIGNIYENPEMLEPVKCATERKQEHS